MLLLLLKRFLLFVGVDIERLLVLYTLYNTSLDDIPQGPKSIKTRY